MIRGDFPDHPREVDRLQATGRFPALQLGGDQEILHHRPESQRSQLDDVFELPAMLLHLGLPGRGDRSMIEAMGVRSS